METVQQINGAIDTCFVWRRRSARLQELWGGFVAFYDGCVRGDGDSISAWVDLENLTSKVELAWFVPTASEIKAIVPKFQRLCTGEGATARQTEYIQHAIDKCFRDMNGNPKLRQLWGDFVGFYNSFLRKGTAEHISVWRDLIAITRETEQV
ncbi:hypothetical protein ACCS93_39295 [Rhizobium ruizarguesonis]